MFLSGNDRGLFYRSLVHGNPTAHYLAVAANLSPKHGFLGFSNLTLDDDGALTYEAYNRFPIGGYVLLKLAMSPFGDDLSAQIRSARTLMLVFFVLGAVSAYLALCRLVASRWVALAATLTTFSSYYLLYFSDMVATENMPSLFGVLLTLHGMVVFVQEGPLPASSSSRRVRRCCWDGMSMRCCSPSSCSAWPGSWSRRCRSSRASGGRIGLGGGGG